MNQLVLSTHHLDLLLLPELPAVGGPEPDHAHDEDPEQDADTDHHHTHHHPAPARGHAPRTPESSAPSIILRPDRPGQLRSVMRHEMMRHSGLRLSLRPQHGPRRRMDHRQLK